MKRTLALTALSIICLATTQLRALPITIDPPRDREFVRDLANMIDANDEQQIKQIADQLLTDTATPIIVVTIDSMANHGGAGMRIETFATLLFDQWGVGQKQLDGRDWNTGILLLVSKNDRKARIELGGGWRRDHDLRAGQIMEGEIIPKFRQSQFSQGILAGVTALDRMTRGVFGPLAVSANTVPTTPRTAQVPSTSGSPGYNVERDPSAPAPPPPPAPGPSSGQPPPPISRPSPRSPPGFGIGSCSPICLIVGIIIVMSIVRGGMRSAGHGMRGGTTGLLGALLYGILASQGGRRSYGSSTWSPRGGGSSGFSFGGGGGGRSLGSRGFGGGSFGGGHSGGGGATGSW